MPHVAGTHINKRKHAFCMQYTLVEFKQLLLVWNLFLVGQSD